ncbi:acyl carrier protein [Flavobacterium covae]|uniref:acyl carrier protein n=1 Tax=Flavobacterium covae TaxID=2906076 RepID=UPI000B5B798C|nr:acyl carrier protein [Flavobacterium covae]MCJ1805905.1 acyl carrier protein [Flavobacterium covae]OXA80185.1 acyl carrier protein [Flavobacterium columnare] [Flavobacterium columnare NBRC 100251 = ATCC 23463]
MENFLEQMAEIMEVDTVKKEDVLQSFEAWDSLATLSIIALADEEYGVSLVNQEIIDSNTIEGLYNVIQSKK